MAKSTNMELKNFLLESNVSYAELAEKMKMKESVLAAMMNTKLPDATMAKMRSNVVQIVKERSWDVPLADEDRSAICQYNSGIQCMTDQVNTAKCRCCGWNPEVSKARKKVPFTEIAANGKAVRCKVLRKNRNV